MSEPLRVLVVDDERISRLTTLHQLVDDGYVADTVGDAKPATVYTAATDPNKLLGRPGGYTSKADFTDDRAKPDLDDEVQNGGSVEVYDDPADAEERGKFIADTLDKMKIFGTEYHYLKGGILLRVSGELTPEQAAGYETALNKL